MGLTSKRRSIMTDLQILKVISLKKVVVPSEMIVRKKKKNKPIRKKDPNE